MLLVAFLPNSFVFVIISRGSLPSIPICSIYIQYTGLDSEFGVGLAASIVMMIFMGVAVSACYPNESGGGKQHSEGNTMVCIYYCNFDILFCFVVINALYRLVFPDVLFLFLLLKITFSPPRT